MSVRNYPSEAEYDIYEVAVKSSDLIYGTLDGFSVNLSRCIKPDYVSVVSAEIPASFYVITTGNNEIPFQENIGVAATATLTSGNYTPSTLAAEIATQMSAVSPNVRAYTVTYSAITDVITISVNLGTFALLWASSTQKLWRNLGYTSSSTTQAASQTNPRGLQLSYNYVFLNIAQFSTANVSSGPTAAGFLAKVPLGVNSYGVAMYNEGQMEQSSRVSPTPISKLDVSIAGDSDGIITLGMRNDWSFTLRCREKRC